MANDNRRVISKSVVINRIKTSLYALSAVVLAGWITEGLNEQLTLRIITRHLYPDLIEKYEHPFSDTASFFIWLIPLLFTFALMLGLTLLTVHNLRKRHIYNIKKPNSLTKVDNIILIAPLERLEEAINDYKNAGFIHIIAPEASYEKEAQKVIKNFIEQQDKITVYTLAGAATERGKPKTTNNLQTLSREYVKVISRIASKHTKQDLAFDLKYAHGLGGSAAMYISLESDVNLVYPSGEHFFEYEVVCEMES